MTSFTELPEADPAPHVGNGHARATRRGVVDEVVGGKNGRRGRLPNADLRRRLSALQDAADRELQRRGVAPLRAPSRPRLPSLPTVAHLRGIANAADRTRAVRNALGELGESEQAEAVRGALSALGRVRPPRIPGREALQQELPMQLMGAMGQLAISLRNLTGRDVIDLESMQDVMSAVFRALEVRRHHNAGQWNVDEFGFDPEYTEAIMPLVRLVYRKYWRVDAIGVRNVPRRGAALLVSNHAGVLPYDGAMIETALFEGGVDRHARALIADWFFGMPMLSWLLRRTGQTLGHPDDTHRLLRSGELVLVFPEGIKGTGKLWRERYRLRRFGRGGFAESAIRAGAPIVPISVVGSEELYPMLYDARPLARLTGFPYFPLTPTWPWFGPLGLIPLPSKWRIEFHQPVPTDHLPPDAADDPSVVMRIADQVRDVIQEGVVSNLMQRRGAFRG
jgi:1-acyl-sn-glycerol-3-phosphate acyltransferase